MINCGNSFVAVAKDGLVVRKQVRIGPKIGQQRQADRQLKAP